MRKRKFIILTAMWAMLALSGCGGEEAAPAGTWADREADAEEIKAAGRETERQEDAMKADLPLSQDYRSVMQKYDMLDLYGLTEYGRISVGLSEEGAELIDRGDWYEVTNQKLKTPVYYEWEYIKDLKPGDLVTYVDWNGEKSEYELNRLVAEKEKQYRVFEALPKQEGDAYAVVFCFEDIFKNGKYAMAQTWEEQSGDYRGYDFVDRPNDLVDCSIQIVYRGSFILSKNCEIAVNGEKLTPEEMMDSSIGWGFLDGWITEIDENGCITEIMQQTAG